MFATEYVRFINKAYVHIHKFHLFFQSQISIRMLSRIIYTYVSNLLTSLYAYHWLICLDVPKNTVDSTFINRVKISMPGTDSIEIAMPSVLY